MLTLHHTRKAFRIWNLGFGILSAGEAKALITTKSEIRIPQSEIALAFYTNNLLDLSDNFDQVFLVLHYRFN
jgi:hypothetical protein